MTVTFTPGNRYADIAALAATPPPPQPRLRLARLVIGRLAEDTGVAPPKAPTHEERVAAKVARRAALLADYAAAFPALESRGDHAALIRRLANRYDASRSYTSAVTAEWRKARGLAVPIRTRNVAHAALEDGTP